MSFVADSLKGKFTEAGLFQEVANLPGETFRAVADRRTFKFQLDNQFYFAKIHYGVGWREIFKNLLQLRLPVLGAKNEWRALHKLKQLQVETMTPVAYTSLGVNPAAIRSCLVTESLEGTISLEDLVLAQKLTMPLKRQLLNKIGNIACRLHANGVNHRDFYICHFLLPTVALDTSVVGPLYLIDLHRAQIRSGEAPARWREKDLSALLFSAADAGLTRTDLIRFVHAYLGPNWRDAINAERTFWRRVVSRAERLYRKDHGRPSAFLAQLGGAL